MSLIKSLIQRLLDSRTTPEEAGHSAMPSTSYITPTATAVQAWGQMAQGVAPFDGFVRASARASNTSSNIRVTNDTATVFAQSEGTATGQTQGVFVPVAKGDSWTVYGTNRDNVVVRLVKAIGGGYKHFVRRALPCLRPSFNYLPRSFCKAKNSGLAVKHSLKQLLHWMFRHVPSLHRLMGILDTSILSAVEANSCSIWIRVKKYLAVKSLVIAGFLQQIPTARQQYLSRKAVLLLLLPMRCSIKFGLLRLQARHNLRTGGALC